MKLICDSLLSRKAKVDGELVPEFLHCQRTVCDVWKQKPHQKILSICIVFQVENGYLRSKYKLWQCVPEGGQGLQGKEVELMGRGRVFDVTCLTSLPEFLAVQQKFKYILAGMPLMSKKFKCPKVLRMSIVHCFSAFEICTFELLGVMLGKHCLKKGFCRGCKR